MMRTIEILIVIIIITGAFITASFFAVLPWPRQVSPMNLRRLAFTTLQMLDTNHDLSKVAFETDNYTLWSGLQIALAASLPPNIIYNLTVYEVAGEATQLYTIIDSMSNAESLGTTSDASKYMVASSNVTFNVIPEKIGEHGDGGTLYILNCSDANSWWITGYTAHSLAKDLFKLLSPYFSETVMVQSTAELAEILDGNALQGETLQGATVINTFGEAVPIPSDYCTAPYSTGSYANYIHFLGERVRIYNWTWSSIVGYPFYYVSNTGYFTGSGDHNTWGIYGMKAVGAAGLTAFLQGVDDKTYSYDQTWLTESVGSVTLTQEILGYSNYYGVYPSPSQTSTRALKDSILGNYHLTVGFPIFDKKSGCYPGAIFQHVFSDETDTSGSLLALGLTRTPDIRLTALGILSYYQPRLYSAEYDAEGTSRIVALQLGLVGGV